MKKSLFGQAFALVTELQNIGEDLKQLWEEEIRDEFFPSEPPRLCGSGTMHSKHSASHGGTCPGVTQAQQGLIDQGYARIRDGKFQVVARSAREGSPTPKKTKEAYPHPLGDSIALGPETVIDATHMVIAHKGENYYKEKPVTSLQHGVVFGTIYNLLVDVAADLESLADENLMIRSILQGKANRLKGGAQYLEDET